MRARGSGGIGILLAGAALALGGCSLPGNAKPAWGGGQPADGVRYETAQRPEPYLNRYGETVYQDAPSGVPVWRTQPGPETGPHGHERIQPEYVGYEARDVVVEQQRMGMTAANGQWPQSVYNVNLPGMNQPKPGFFTKIASLFVGSKQPSYVGLRTYNSDYSGEMGYGSGKNFGTSYGAGGGMSYAPVNTANWGGTLPPGTITPRIEETRKLTEDMDADGFTTQETPRFAQTAYGNASNPQAALAYQKLTSKKKKTKAQTKPACQVTPRDAPINDGTAWYSDEDFK